MANFVETATLRLVDQSSKQAATIDAQLRKLLKTADAMDKRFSTLKQLKINFKDIVKADTAMSKLIAQQVKLSKTVAPKFDMRSIAGADKRVTNLINKLNSLGTFTANVKVKGGGSLGGNQTGSKVGSKTSKKTGGNNGGGGNGINGGYSINMSPLQAWGIDFTARLGRTIEHSIIAGFALGTRNVAFGESNLKLLGYTPEQIKKVDERSYDFSRQWRGVFSPDDIRILYKELGPLLGADPERATPLVGKALDYQAILLSQGISRNQSEEGIRALFKAIDNMNRLVGQDGNISGTADDYIEAIFRETVRAGRDITPEKINTAVVYSRTTGKTMTPEGLITLINMLDSMGRVSGTSLNRFVNNLAGQTTASALQEQAEWGLITTKEVDEGSTGSNRRRKIVRDTTTDEELLRRDPNQWAMAYLLPAIIKKSGVNANNQADVDALFNNPERIAKLLDPLFGSVVAKDVALNFATWQAEYEKSKEAHANVANSEQRKQITLDNPILAFEGAQKNAVNLLGEIGNSLSKNLIGPLQTLNGQLINLGEWVRNGDKDGGSSAMRAGAVIGVGAVGSYAAYQGIAKMLGISEFRFASVNINDAADKLRAAAARFGGGVGGATQNGKGGSSKGVVFGNAKTMAAGVALVGANIGNGQLQNSDAPTPVKIVGDIAASTANGAAVGAGIGSIVPGIGTGIGGFTGGVVGGLYSGVGYMERNRTAKYQQIEAKSMANGAYNEYMNKFLEFKLKEQRGLKYYNITEEQAAKISKDAFDMQQKFIKAGGIIVGNHTDLAALGRQEGDPMVIKIGDLAIADRKERPRGFTSQHFIPSVEDGIQLEDNTLDHINRVIATTSDEFITRFEGSSGDVGTAIGENLASFAPGIGQAIAAQINANISVPPIDVNINQPPLPANTGNNSNNAR